MITPAADNVIVFESKTGRIDQRVTTRTGRIVAMLGKLFTNRGGSTNVRFYRFDIGVRLRGWRSHDAVQHPRTAENRRRRCAVGSHFQNAGHREDSASMAVRRQRYLAKCHSFDTRNAVKLSQPTVQKSEVGSDEVRQTQIMLQQLVKKESRLFDAGDLQHIIKFWIEHPVGHRVVDGSQAEPLICEVLGERGRFGIAQHSFDLLAKN